MYKKTFQYKWSNFKQLVKTSLFDCLVKQLKSE